MPNYEMLLELATHLEKPANQRGHRKFVFNKVNTRMLGVKPTPVGEKIPGCGTAGCAMGEAPILWPDKISFRAHADYEEANWWFCLGGTVMDYIEAASTLFCIEMKEAWALFSPGCPRWWADDTGLPKNATAKQVAKSIREFVAFKRSRPRFGRKVQ